MKRFLLFLTILFFFSSIAQNLKPGFDKKEYSELLMAFSRWSDSNGYKDIP